MNPLLVRQLRNYLPDLAHNDPACLAFLAAVSTAYDEMQRDRVLVGHTLEVISAELTEANEKLRQEAENRLQSLSRYYQQTLELQQGMILCFKKTDRGFQHTLCRGRLAQRLGWTSDRVEGRLLEEFLPPVEAESMRMVYVQAWAGQECTYEGKALGGELAYLAQLRPRREGSEVCEVIVSCVEITDLKRFERELLAAKNRAEAADRAKGEFLAVMSHEIRTPLNAILGFGQLLRESELSQRQHTWLSSVETSGEALRALIDDILDFSKIEAGKLELDLQPVRLSEFLESIAALFRPRAAQKHLEFRLRLGADLPEMVVTDAMRLRQILVNLVGNALKFTQRGSVTMAVSVAGEKAAGGATETVLLFEVIDSGVGIKDEQRARIFKPFSQADSSTTRNFGGTGLGLAICKRLAGALGGDIDFESCPGKGSRFFFGITARALPRLEPAGNAGENGGSSLGRLQILIVEDHPTNRLLMEQILLRLGCRADFAENGHEAIISASARDYDLVIMDLQMPDMDGYAAMRGIRACRGDRPQPRIIALTADSLDECQAKCLAEGVSAVLTKPVRVDALRSELVRTMPVGVS